MMMLSSWISVTAALLLLAPHSGESAAAAAGSGSSSSSTTSQFNPIDNLFGSGGIWSARKQRMMNEMRNASKPLMMDPFAPTPEEREAERDARRKRQRERNERVKEKMKYMKPDIKKMERVSEEELNANPELKRNLGWVTGGSSSQAVEYANPGDDYDMWQQAYRMLGGFIDCDHQKSEGSGDKNDGDDGDGQFCSRWMMWAAVSYR